MQNTPRRHENAQQTPAFAASTWHDLEGTGLQYLRARYYDSASGRFNRLDPFAGRIQDPQSLHKYLYGHGDPVNMVDPTGMFGLAGFSAGFGIANSIRSIHTEGVLSVFDAAVTTINGIQAGQNAQQIIGSFVGNQMLGFGLGFVGGRVFQRAAAIWEQGFTFKKSGFNLWLDQTLRWSS